MKALSTTQIDKRSFWVYIPAVLAVGYVPLIMRGFTFTRDILSNQIWFPDGAWFDFFLFFKSISIVILAIISLIIFLTDGRKRIKPDFIWIPLAVYTVFVIISGFRSPYGELIFSGSYEMMEGMPVVLSYIVLAFVTSVYVRRDGADGIRFIMICASPGILLILIVGFLQGAGINLITALANAGLLASKELMSAFGTFATDIENPVFSTLYNVDYAGVYFVMIAAVSGAMIFISKQTVQRVVFALCFIFSVTDAILTGTATAVITLMLLVIISIVLWAVRDRKRRKLILLILAGVAVAFSLIAISNDHVKKNLDNIMEAKNAGAIPLTKVSTDTSGITYHFGEDKMTISFDKETGYPVRESDDITDYIESASITCNTDEEYRVEINIITKLKGLEDEVNWSFAHYPESGRYYYMNPAGKEEIFPEPAENAGIFPEKLFNNRGLIWNRTIPLLKKHLLFGSGSNTFIMEYPQGDYIEELRFGGRLLDVKPHSFYLQQWMDHGLVAFIALLVFIFWLVKRLLVQLAYGKRDTDRVFLAAGGIAFIAAFLVAGITMDGSVCTSPVFFTLCGAFLGMTK